MVFFEPLVSHQAIQVLEAEWRFLNQPNRLQRLAENHLELVPLLPSQIGLIGDIPLKDSNQNFTDILDIWPDFIRPAAELPRPAGKRSKKKRRASPRTRLPDGGVRRRQPAGKRGWIGTGVRGVRRGDESPRSAAGDVFAAAREWLGTTDSGIARCSPSSTSSVYYPSPGAS